MKVSRVNPFSYVEVREKEGSEDIQLADSQCPTPEVWRQRIHVSTLQAQYPDGHPTVEARL